MSGPPLVFLDANILFSAAVGGRAFALLFALAREGRLRLGTSRACVVEAETNLTRKRPDALAALSPLLVDLSVWAHTEDDEHVEWARDLVHADDVHVLAAARRASADVLLTGDVTHFRHLMQRDDLGLKVRTPRAFLLERQ